ncbi:hypothetical protein BDW75DRAFT_208114 [Aspergillus navahoensis]
MDSSRYSVLSSWGTRRTLLRQGLLYRSAAGLLPLVTVKVWWIITAAPGPDRGVGEAEKGVSCGY